jgi:uncharacterized protein (DUF1778 family)
MALVQIPKSLLLVDVRRMYGVLHRKEITLKTVTSPQAAETADQRSSKEGRLNLRVTERQDHLIRRAAAALDKSVTEFVLDSVALEAERVLAEQRWFMLSETEWSRFHELLDQPLPADDQRLQRLLSERRQIDLSDL